MLYNLSKDIPVKSLSSWYCENLLQCSSMTRPPQQLFIILTDFFTILFPFSRGKPSTRRTNWNARKPATTIYWTWQPPTPWWRNITSTMFRIWLMWVCTMRHAFVCVYQLGFKQLNWWGLGSICFSLNCGWSVSLLIWFASFRFSKCLLCVARMSFLANWICVLISFPSPSGICVFIELLITITVTF